MVSAPFFACPGPLCPGAAIIFRASLSRKASQRRTADPITRSDLRTACRAGRRNAHSKRRRQPDGMNRAGKIGIRTGAAGANLHVRPACRADRHQAPQRRKKRQAGEDRLAGEMQLGRNYSLAHYLAADDLEHLSDRRRGAYAMAEAAQHRFQAGRCLRRGLGHQDGAFVSHQHGAGLLTREPGASPLCSTQAAEGLSVTTAVRGSTRPGREALRPGRKFQCSSLDGVRCKGGANGQCGRRRLHNSHTGKLLRNSDRGPGGRREHTAIVA